MDYVQKGDTDKISALTNRGLDPNFIDRASGGMELSHTHTHTYIYIYLYIYNYTLTHFVCPAPCG